MPKKGREARECLQAGLSGAVKVQSPVEGRDLYEISTSFQLFQQELDILHFFTLVLLINLNCIGQL